jgi:hypothetical protein
VFSSSQKTIRVSNTAGTSKDISLPNYTAVVVKGSNTIRIESTLTGYLVHVNGKNLNDYIAENSGSDDIIGTTVDQSTLGKVMVDDFTGTITGLRIVQAK